MSGAFVGNITALLLSSEPGYDAIDWNGKVSDVPHAENMGCIHPPPFGQQCTVHASSSLFSCLRAQPGCHALSCPSPEPYTKLGRRDGITGPICQLRSAQWQQWLQGASRARRHGMCNVQGCKNFFLTRVTLRGMPGGRRKPPARYALVVAESDPQLERYLGLLRAAAVALPADDVVFGSAERTVARSGRAESYMLYALDTQALGRIYNLAGVHYAGTGSSTSRRREVSWREW